MPIAASSNELEVKTNLFVGWAALEFSERTPVEEICVCQREDAPFVDAAWPYTSCFQFA
jgi:hypothetical protein